MIRLDSIEKKITKGKTKNKIIIRNIFLDFPSHGLFLVTSKSESEKNALLNILGGLDTPTRGTLSFNQSSVTYHGKKKMNSISLEEYKDEIGFIFQQDNYLKNTSLLNNLLIGSKKKTEEANKQISKIIEKENLNKSISKIIEKVGCSDIDLTKEVTLFQDRQIAIARSFYQENQVLLADEPLDELNEAEQQRILLLLKEYSKQHLVIVFSRMDNLQSIELDGFIEMDNGQIKSKRLLTPKENRKENNEFSSPWKKQNRVIPKEIFRFNKKKITFLSLFFFIMSILLLFTICISQYNSADMNYTYLKKNDCSSVYLTEVDSYALEYLQSIPNVSLCDEYYANSKNQLLEMGFEFYEKELPFEKNCCYVSDNYVRYLFHTHQKITKNEETIQLNEEDYQITDVVGCQIGQKKVSGIYKDLIEENDMTLSEAQKYELQRFNQGYIEYKEESFPGKTNNEWITSYLTGDKKKYELTDNYKGNGKNIIVEKWGDARLINSSYPDDLKDNEVYITLGTYNRLFGTNYLPKNLVTRLVDESGITCDCEGIGVYEKIGTLLNFEIKNNLEQKTKTISNLKIKGIIINDDEFSIPFSQSLPQGIYFSENNLEKVNYYSKTRGVWMKVDNFNHLQTILRTLSKKYLVSIVTPISITQQSIEPKITSLFYGVAIALLLVLILNIVIAIRFINTMIYPKYKEIFLMKTLGIKSIQIMKKPILILLLLYVFQILIAVGFVFLIPQLLNLGFKATTYCLFLPNLHNLISFAVISFAFYFILLGVGYGILSKNFKRIA